MAELRSLGLDVACFSSACCVKNQEYVEATLAEGMETIDLAARAGVPFVRILADREPHAEGDVDDAAVAVYDAVAWVNSGPVRAPNTLTETVFAKGSCDTR